MVRPDVLIDARMRKRAYPEVQRGPAQQIDPQLRLQFLFLLLREMRLAARFSVS